MAAGLSQLVYNVSHLLHNYAPASSLKRTTTSSHSLHILSGLATTFAALSRQVSIIYYYYCHYTFD